MARATVAVVLPLAVGVVGTEAAAARTFTVTTTKDRGHANLRGALKRADRHRGADRIEFAHRLQGDIRIKRSLRARESVTIDGGRHRAPVLVSVRQRGGRYPNLYFEPPIQGRDQQRLVIRSLRIRSLGVFGSGPVAIKDSTFTEGRRNQAKGISSIGVHFDWSGSIADSRFIGWDIAVGSYRAGDVSVEDSVITGNRTGTSFVYTDDIQIERTRITRNREGVELSHYASGEIDQSLISGNSPGGGLYVGAGAVEVKRSTIAGNKALRGGGVELVDAGAAIRNSTISGNSAKGTDAEPGRGGGIYGAYGRSISVTASTITGNRAATGGGIFLGTASKRDEATVESSIIAGNMAPTGGDCFSTAHPDEPLSGGGNVFGIAGCGTADPSDILTADPGLAPLAGNGGPTPTHALLPGSPAIGNGVDVGLGADQRGVERDAHPDSGSFELR